MKFILAFKRWALTISLFTLAVACSTSPTGRRQLTLVPEGQLAQMGQQSWEQIKAEKPVYKGEAANRYIQCIANAIVSELPEQEMRSGWDVAVFEDQAVNAFALPGKHIGVNTGIIKAAQSADQLAAVIGHEVGHVLAEHSNERVSQTIVAQGGLTAAQIALNQRGSDSNRLLLAALGAGVQYGVLLPYSRKHESESDEIGLELMAKAGFNPEAAVEFWQSMRQQGGGAPPELLSTHPSADTRIERLREQLPEAKKLYQQARADGQTPNCDRPQLGAKSRLSQATQVRGSFLIHVSPQTESDAGEGQNKSDQ